MNHRALIVSVSMMKLSTLLLPALLLGFPYAMQAAPAQWINCFFNQSTTNEWTCFRKNFNLDKVPEHATARIAVESKYWMWINETLVVFEGGVKRGPNPQDIYYDEVEIAPYLVQGKNNISVLVWYFGKQGFSYNPSGTTGLFIMNEGQYGLERMKRRYKYMLDHPFTTLFEAWGLGGQGGFDGGTVNHAWSGGGLTIMSQYMCGVAPIEPAYKRFAVLPQPAGVASASMSMLSVAGPIATSYKIAGKTFTLKAEVPAGTEAVLGIPREFATGRISLNGKTAWNKGVYSKVSGVKPEADDSGWVKFAVSAGKFKLQAE